MAKLQGYKKKSHCPPLKWTMTSLDCLNENVLKHFLRAQYKLSGRLLEKLAISLSLGFCKKCLNVETSSWKPFMCCSAVTTQMARTDNNRGCQVFFFHSIECWVLEIGLDINIFFNVSPYPFILSQQPNIPYFSRMVLP